MQEPTNETVALLAEMRAEITALRQRVQALERSAAAPAPVTEEDMIAISAAVAAFLGVRARIRQVRLVHSSAWAQVGRMGTHASHHTH
jgi:methylmalonyl-CoA carboxyltransferase large subunit